jgi:hypothetical protein
MSNFLRVNNAPNQPDNNETSQPSYTTRGPSPHRDSVALAALSDSERRRLALQDPHSIQNMNRNAFFADGTRAGLDEGVPVHRRQHSDPSQPTAAPALGGSNQGPAAAPIQLERANMTRISTIRDEQETMAEGMADALFNRMAPSAKLSDNGRRFRSMTMLEMARELLQAGGENVRGLDRMELSRMALQSRSMSTSDFPSILANVANKRMRLGYEENIGTYKIWARQAANALNFKPISVTQLSGAPDLLKVSEHGEFQYGQMSDGAETYALLTYGRMVSLTRQALVNDELRAFDVALAGFGGAAARLENRTVYAQLTANAAMSDGAPLFGGAHKNVGTGSTSALQLSSLASMRSSMRQQHGRQSEELNISPRYLIVPAALEQAAYQLTSANYVPARSSDVNEFRQGGRASLEPVVEPILDNVSSTAWYAAASSGQIDTVEYCYLDGAEGPVLEARQDFLMDGVTMKCRLDFAAKAIDFRGLYMAPGV